MIHSEAVRHRLTSLSIWCHCPYYLQGITHFGLLAGLGTLLADLWDIDLDPGELEANWEKMNAQIQEMIDKNPEVQELIRKLRKGKGQGVLGRHEILAKNGDKVIHLQDFLEPR